MSRPRRAFPSRTSSSRPSHHANNSATSFINPWPSAGLPTWAEMVQGSFPFGWYDKAKLRRHHRARDVKVVRPDWGTASLQKNGLDRSKSIVGTWLGHAGTLVEFPPLKERKDEEVEAEQEKSIYLLFDPIFSSRAGPTQYQGVARFKESPCQVADLPGCDAVFISHSHYDHLDTPTIKAISKRFPKARFFVPLGIKQWFSSIGVSNELVFELDWWQDRELSLSDFGHQETTTATATSSTDDQKKKTVGLKFSCVPAQHNSGRSPTDQGSTLWCGWVVERFVASQNDSPGPQAQAHPPRKRQGAIYHAGDTGYRRTSKSEVLCPIFTEIGAKFGPFDLSFIPIWRGGSLGFISYLGLRLSHHDIPSALHASPTDAADVHVDVQSRNTVGIHFGTFVGSENETVEAIVEFAQACEERGIGRLDGDQVEGEKGRAGTLDIGESLAVDFI